MPISTVSAILAVLTILGQAMIVLGLAYYFIRRKKSGDIILNFLNRNGLWLAFLVALTSVLGSLYYSEIAKFAVCDLCWYQRIFMYPQVLLLGLAAWKNDKNIAPYGMILAAFGAVISAYQYYLQIGGASVASCQAVGYSVSCSQRFIMQFGYITIPIMSLTAFLMIILLMALKKNINQTVRELPSFPRL